ncbi:MAG: T9SS type A sorting domain-containing protein [Bacteroidetes bacterium]|nr:T9SS type A sorting domain-containing protein [Bacteroidota bacterium]
MKKYLTLRIFVALFSLLLFSEKGFCVARTWTGAVNLDFNNGGNWTGAGGLLATDVLTYTGTVTQTITVSASVTIGGLTFVANSAGAVTDRLDVGAFTLTINGSSLFNAVHIQNPLNYDVVQVNVNTGGNIIFNGSCLFHTNGSGDTYLTTGNFATGATTNPGTVWFNGYLGVGAYGRTVGLYEPHMIFDAAGAQTLNIKCNGGAYMFKSENMTFGSANTPTVTVDGKGAVYFDSYDGNMTISANTTVIVPDSSLVGYMCRMDRYNATGGTFTMGANSLLKTGCPNGLAPFNGWNVLQNFTTYTLATTSTVWYNSTGYQGIHNNTYGNLIVDGNGNPGWKYSYGGAYTVASAMTAQGTCIYGPYNASNLTVVGNTLIQTAATWNASADNAVANQTYTLQGDYTNNATFTSGSPVGVNTFLFNSGAVGQNIGGSSVTTFYNLTNNNISGFGCTLTQNENVSNVWTLTNGPVHLNSKTITVQNNAAAAIVRTSGYAISETSLATNPSIIAWDMGATTGNHIFPFGVAGVYIPITFNKIPATAAIVSIATRATAANDNLPWATGVTQMYDPNLAASGAIPATVDRWWDFNSTASITANVTFSYRGIENTLSAPYNTGNLGAQYWSGGWLPNNSNIGSAAAVGAGVGTVTANGITVAASFMPWVLSSTTVPLPIELVNLVAVCTGTGNDIQWATASETNNHFFTVERSDDGNTFSEVAHLDGAGTSSAEHHYSYTDDYKKSGTIYYRIRQTDYNGQSTTSKIVTVSPCMNTDAMSVYSSESTININLNVSDGNTYLMNIMDMSGNLISSDYLTAQSGTNLFQVDNKVPSTGIYFITLTGENGKRFTQRLYLTH